MYCALRPVTGLPEDGSLLFILYYSYGAIMERIIVVCYLMRCGQACPGDSLSAYQTD